MVMRKRNSIPQIIHQAGEDNHILDSLDQVTKKEWVFLLAGQEIIKNILSVTTL
jgi:hypothetical protein